MPKWLKSVVAVLLLPLCVGATQAVGQVVQAGSAADRFWVALVAGVACWVVVYTLLPRPMRLYVLGHELTHALVAWFSGRKVRRIRVGRTSGSVAVERANWAITLAPYFVPFYAALVVLVFSVGNLFLGWEPFVAWFHLLLGAAYAFHVTFTAHALSTPQSDLAQEGTFFALVVIWLGNVLVLLLAVPLLTAGVGVLTALSWWLHDTGRVLTWLHRLF